MMGSNDGSEICDITGIYISSQLSNILPQEDIGLYRDDGPKKLALKLKLRPI